MGIEYYAFALFIAALLCLIAILCKVLFSNVKRQYKLLDEKESKLLQLYRSVEGVMEEFGDQVKATTDELKDYEARISARAAAFIMPKPAEAAKVEQFEKLPRAERIDTGRIRAANEMLARAERIVKSNALKSPAPPAKNENGTVFQRLFDEQVSEPAAAETTVQHVKNEAILKLSEEGKTDVQIASELGITRNEVQLVIGITGKK